MGKNIFAGKTVFVVDDDFNTLITLQSVLEISGSNVFTFENGEDALEKVENIRPDLILSDVMMPEMDGFELCQRIKHNPKTSSIPIILVTGLEHIESILQGFQEGATDYIVKPFDMDHVRARIERTFAMSAGEKQYLPETDDSLEEATLVGYLRLCKHEQINGTLHILKSGREGTIHLKAGEILSVQLDALFNKFSLEDILEWKWKDGGFVLESEETDAIEEDQQERESLLDVAVHESSETEPEEEPEEEAYKQEHVIEEQAVGEEPAMRETFQPAPGKEVTSMATKTQQLKEVLESVKAEFPDADVTIVASDGTVFASSVSGSDATRIGAMIATIIGLSRRACQTLKRGEATEALLKGSEGFISIYPAGTKANLGVTTKSEANLGMLNLVGREAAEKIQEILS